MMQFEDNDNTFKMCIYYTGSFIKKKKDVGMGLSMASCLSIGISLFPLFFMKWHPYIPLHFREMIFPLVPLTSSLGAKPN